MLIMRRRESGGEVGEGIEEGNGDGRRLGLGW